MLELLVIRHAIALSREHAAVDAVEDAERPLTAVGRARFKRVARALGRRVPEVTLLACSPLRRAMETADLVARARRDLEITQTDALLPDASPEALFDFLAHIGPHTHVAVVGHEPHLSSWVSYALTGDRRPVLELKKGGACYVRFDDLPQPAAGRLHWLLTPAWLRRAQRR